jgi:hypothetical protein
LTWSIGANAESRKSKRPRASQRVGEEDGENEVEEIPSYPYLSAVNRRVSRLTIAEKWVALPQSSIDLISQLLADIQRPVLFRLNDEHKRSQAKSIMQMTCHRLLYKISKGLPFPRGISRQREDDFDFEKLIDRTRILEGQLTAEIDANKLLDSNLNKEISWLDSEKAALADLERNARSEAVKSRDDARKLHPLIQSDSSTMEDDSNDSNSLGLVPSRVPPSLEVRRPDNIIQQD